METRVAHDVRVIRETGEGRVDNDEMETRVAHDVTVN